MQRVVKRRTNPRESRSLINRILGVDSQHNLLKIYTPTVSLLNKISNNSLITIESNSVLKTLVTSLLIISNKIFLINHRDSPDPSNVKEAHLHPLLHGDVGTDVINQIFASGLSEVATASTNLEYTAESIIEKYELSAKILTSLLTQYPHKNISAITLNAIIRIYSSSYGSLFTYSLIKQWIETGKWHVEGHPLSWNADIFEVLLVQYMHSYLAKKDNIMQSQVVMLEPGDLLKSTNLALSSANRANYLVDFSPLCTQHSGQKYQHNDVEGDMKRAIEALSSLKAKKESQRTTEEHQQKREPSSHEFVSIILNHMSQLSIEPSINSLYTIFKIEGDIPTICNLFVQYQDRADAHLYQQLIMTILDSVKSLSKAKGREERAFLRLKQRQTSKYDLEHHDELQLDAEDMEVKIGLEECLAENVIDDIEDIAVKSKTDMPDDLKNISIGSAGSNIEVSYASLPDFVPTVYTQSYKSIANKDCTESLPSSSPVDITKYDLSNSAEKISLAYALFSYMKSVSIKPRAEIYNDFMTVHSQRGNLSECYKFYNEYLILGGKPGCVMQTTMIKALAVYDKPLLAEKIFRESIDIWKIKPDVVMYSAIIHGFSSNNMIPKALQYSRELYAAFKSEEFTVGCWHILLYMHVRNRDLQSAVGLAESMNPSDVSYWTFNILLYGCGLVRDLDSLEKLHHLMISRKIEEHITTYNTLISAHLNCGDAAGAMKWHDYLLEKGTVLDVRTYNMILIHNISIGRPEVAIEVFNKMISNGIEPQLPTFLSLIKAHALLGQIEKIASIIDTMNEYLCSEQGEKYTKNSSESHLLDFATYNTTKCYNAAIKVLMDADAFRTVVDLSRQPDLFKPNVKTYDMYIRAYGFLRDVEAAKNIFNSLLENNKPGRDTVDVIVPDNSLFNTLVFAFIRCDVDPHEIRAFVDDMNRKWGYVAEDEVIKIIEDLT